MGYETLGLSSYLEKSEGRYLLVMKTLGLTSYLEKSEGIYGLRDSWADLP